MDYLHGPRTPTLVTDVSNDTTKKRETERQTEKEHPPGPAPGQKLPPTEKHTRSSTNDSQDSEGGVSGSHGKPDSGGRNWDEDGKVDKDEVPWIEDAAECAHICKYMQAHSVS